MRLYSSLYRMIDGVTVWSAETFNTIWRSLDERLHKLEERDLTVDGIIGTIVGDTQQAIQDVFDPALLTIQKIQEQGFLLARSSTAIAISEGDVFTFIVDAGDSRDLFTPSTFSVLTRVAATDAHAILRTIDYDRLTGAYRVEVVSSIFAVTGYSDWEIVASAGSTIAMLDYLAESRAIRDVVLPAMDVATAAAASASADADATAADRIQTGLDRAAAANSAAAAATFDPADYFPKTVTYDRTAIDQADNALATAIGDNTTRLSAVEVLASRKITATALFFGAM